MKKPLPIGVENYKEIIEQGYYYVDKTLLIRELLDRKGKVTLFTRPRRFGKTLALSTLQTFFEREYGRDGTYVDNSVYFAGKKILDTGEKYTKEMGQYPVISLSLKSARQPDYEMAYDSLLGEIRREYDRHSYILAGDALTEPDRVQFQAVQNRTACSADYAGALEFLSRCLEKYHGQKVILLLDEYDVPLENAYLRGFYTQMTDFIRALFESALKTNSSLLFAVITGCLRISKESIITGLNNLETVSILNVDYAEYFGFTQPEMDDMLAVYGLSDKKKEVKDWYDGYLFGRTEVYNPWSAISYVRTAATDDQAYPRPYWSNTSSNSIIRELVEEADSATRDEIETLIAGGTVEKAVHEEITCGDIHESRENLWNFLFFTGYLKLTGTRFDGLNIYLTMAIPDEEVRYIYQNTIVTWFEGKLRKTDFTPLRKAIEQGDGEAFGTFVSGQLMDTISFFDYAENYYHGFLVGLLQAVGSYQVESNREAGNGRPDIVLRELRFRGRSAVIEIKVAENFAEMETKCREALNQIRALNYDHELLRDGYQVPVKFGVCFYKKGCLVRCEK